jgi:hypothetical protein
MSKLLSYLRLLLPFLSKLFYFYASSPGKYRVIPGPAQGARLEKNASLRPAIVKAKGKAKPGMVHPKSVVAGTLRAPRGSASLSSRRKA